MAVTLGTRLGRRLDGLFARLVLFHLLLLPLQQGGSLLVLLGSISRNSSSSSP